MTPLSPQHALGGQNSQRVCYSTFSAVTGAAVLRLPPISSLFPRAGYNARVTSPAARPSSSPQPGLFTAAIFAGLLATSAGADTCRYGNGPIATSVSIAPGDDSFAVVTIDNKLAARARTTCDLTIYGVTVTVEYDAGSGALPDWFRISVPPGFAAVPPQILIDDGDSGQVLIVLDDGVGS